MSLKQQWQKVKENWLLLAIILVGLFLFLGIGNVAQFSPLHSIGQGTSAYPEARMAAEIGYYPSPGADFAPQVEERKIIKTASLGTEVEQGQFRQAEQKLKDIITSSDSFLLSENVNKYGTSTKQYLQGNYQIKVETSKYESVVAQLKQLGEVSYVHENVQDVTGQYTNNQINVEIERSRLQRYQQMYAEAQDVEDKITLNDRIFEQERRVKYLEDALKNIDTRIDYTTVSFSLSEKQSAYADVVWVKFSELVRNFVQSANSVLRFLFWIVPWAALAVIGWFIWKLAKKKKK